MVTLENNTAKAFYHDLHHPQPLLNPLKNSRIFLADDSLDSLFLFREALRPEGCRFQWATDGFEALEKLRQLPQVQMILMDYYMPGLNAEQVLVELEKSIDTDPIAAQMWGGSVKPVILFSAAKLSSFHWPELQRFKIIELWQKPLTPSDIRKNLKQVMLDWASPNATQRYSASRQLKKQTKKA